MNDGGVTGLIELHQAEADDAALLLALIHQAFAQYAGTLNPPSGALNDTLGKIRGNLERGHAVIATIAAIPAGCVFYDIEAEHVYLYRLAVLPSYRRRGIAGRLIEYVEEIARERSLPVHLGVRVGLHENQAYYERRGYRLIANHYHPGYTEPTWVMLERRWS